MTLLTYLILGAVLPSMFYFGEGSVSQWFEPMYGLNNLANDSHSHGWTAWVAMFAHLVIVGALVTWRWLKSPKSE